MYIKKKFVSAARPDRNRHIENETIVLVNMVEKSPRNPHKFDRINAGRRPILSDKQPKNNVPTTDPIKNNDWPTLALYAESQTQFNCEKVDS